MGNSQPELQRKDDELKPTLKVLELDGKSDQESVEAKSRGILQSTKTTKEEEPFKWKNLLLIPLGLLSYPFVIKHISLRYILQPKKYLVPSWKLTNYRKLKSLLNDGSFRPDQFYLHGRKGIGLTSAILGFINQSSKSLPTIYISLKGVENPYRDKGALDWWEMDMMNIEDRIKESINLPQLYNLRTEKHQREYPAFKLLQKQLQSLKWMRDYCAFYFIAYLIPLAMPLIWMPVPVLPIEASWFSTMHVPELLYASFASFYLWGIYPILKYCCTTDIPMVVFEDAKIYAVSEEETFYWTGGIQKFRYHLSKKLAKVVVISESKAPHVWSRQQFEVTFDSEYTYTQILEDQQKTDFQNVKQAFMKPLLTHQNLKSYFSNDVIRYFILELKERELTLSEFKQFFDYNSLHSQIVLKEFMKKFQDEILNQNFKDNIQKQQELQRIVKEACRIYDHHQKDKMTLLMNSFEKLYEKVEKQKNEKKKDLNSFIESLGVEAQKIQFEPFRRIDSYILLYEELIKMKILNSEGTQISFESKMKQIAFKLWFLEGGLTKQAKNSTEKIISTDEVRKTP